MEIFLYFYSGFLLVVAIVVGAAILMNRRCAMYDQQFETKDEHESDAAPYPRYYE
ncbi:MULTISPECIES: hypothetical protein [Paraburkholderia]|jgi:hypothetical protein|uniref:hypothetical protein n=1 Tax=Paraburkholderia TaxID=1822464 RepID=UPI0008A779A7|nr:hypothetical protein [Paraburkholderia hospita]SEI28009.1 hypothetical protein SAMN05192544_110418 [Paraburkholderia hospita]